MKIFRMAFPISCADNLASYQMRRALYPAAYKTVLWSPSLCFPPPHNCIICSE